MLEQIRKHRGCPVHSRLLSSGVKKAAMVVHSQMVLASRHVMDAKNDNQYLPLKCAKTALYSKSVS